MPQTGLMLEEYVWEKDRQIDRDRCTSGDEMKTITVRPRRKKSREYTGLS